MTKVSKNPLITVVVPVYKVEDYLDRCVESIVNQTYKNLEIILVDDGSPDRCPKMCDEWAKKDNRIKTIHKKNGGLSDARNKGIDIAKGEYITFVDSDDYITNNNVEFLYNLIIKENADISMGKHYVIYPKKTINAFSENSMNLNPHDCLEKTLYAEDLDVSAWAKLYKMDLFKEVRYPKGRVFEDAATTYKLIDLSNKIAFSSFPIYYYIIRSDSITNNTFNRNKFDLIVSTKEMTNYVREKYQDLENACDRRLMYAYLSTLTQLVKSKVESKEVEGEYKKELFTYIKANRKKVLKDKRIPKRDRFGLLATYLGYKGFKFLWKLYFKLTRNI